VLKNPPVSIEGKIDRPEHHPSAQDGVGFAERTGYYIDQGIED
jgi:hypothetical protein